MAAAGVAACSNSPPPPADTYIDAAVGGGGAMCSTFSSLKTFLQIGTATSPKPNTVQDGGNDRNATVNVSCTVHPQGNGFDIQLSATEDGPNGGSITIETPSGQGTVTTKTSTGITATFATPGGVYREQAGTSDPTGCTITYLYDPSGTTGGIGGDTPVPTSPPIAAGRIWGHIKCPKVQYQSQPGVYCDAEADFIFEQCDQ